MGKEEIAAHCSKEFTYSDWLLKVMDGCLNLKPHLLAPAAIRIFDLIFEQYILQHGRLFSQLEKTLVIVEDLLDKADGDDGE